MRDDLPVHSDGACENGDELVQKGMSSEYKY